jgi:hypothetical protein
MAFCTSCGANLDPSTRFCTACGQPVLTPTAAPVAAAAPLEPASVAQATPARAPEPASAAPATPTYYYPPAATTTKGGGGAMKVILIVIVILVGLAILASAVALLGFRYLARKSRVETSGDRAKVTTPFGTVTAGDAGETARNLGVEIYPGARPLPGGASVNFGGFKTAAAEFQTPDTPDQVQSWYGARYPRSQINVSDQNQHTMVFSTSKGMVTINIEPRDNMTHIQISQVGGTGSGDQEPK